MSLFIIRIALPVSFLLGLGIFHSFVFVGYDLDIIHGESVSIKLDTNLGAMYNCTDRRYSPCAWFFNTVDPSNLAGRLPLDAGQTSNEDIPNRKLVNYYQQRFVNGTKYDDYYETHTGYYPYFIESM